jgi:hypothetical protein
MTYHAPRSGTVELQPLRAYRPESLYTRKAKKQAQISTVDREAHLFILQVYLQQNYKFSKSLPNPLPLRCASDCIQKHKGS